MKTELLRVVGVGNVLVPDLHGRLPGRGAHVHPDPGCLDLADRRRAFVRALRMPGPFDTAALRREVAESAGSTLGAASRDSTVREHMPTSKAGRVTR